MINIGITTFNRKDFLCNCVDSILKHTEIPFSLFIYDDASYDGTVDCLKDRYNNKGIVLIKNKVRSGIVKGFNTLWEVSEKTNDNEYFCYIQDDTIVTKGWLNLLINTYKAQQLHSDYKVGLFSGHNAPEHPTVATKEVNGVEVLIKKSMRATNMIAPYSFWHRIGKVPLNNLDGTKRGFPGPPNPDGSRGKGSQMDIYITGFQSKGVFVEGEAGPTCSWRLGTYCMIVPGLVKHSAVKADESTWGNPNKEWRPE